MGIQVNSYNVYCDWPSCDMELPTVSGEDEAQDKYGWLVTKEHKYFCPIHSKEFLKQFYEDHK